MHQSPLLRPICLQQDTFPAYPHFLALRFLYFVLWILAPDELLRHSGTIMSHVTLLW